MKFKSYSFKELLSNIVDNRGKTCPVGAAGLPLIATNCIKEHSLYPVFEKVRYVSDETYTNWFRGHPQPGDMIFVCKGSPGRVNWVPDPVNFCIAQDMVAIRADTTKVYPKYLFALLRSQASQQKILNMHVGSLIPHFKKGDFGNLYFEIPEDLEYQKKVGDAYFDFCLKIESNNQLNQTLEQMAQAIFKSWFVDFDPVKAKMNGEQPEGMDAATASLFPEKLVETDMGEIPEGWQLVPVGKLLSKTIGGDWGKEEPDAKHTEEVRIVRGTDIPKLHGGAIESVPVRYVEAKKLKTRKLERGDIVIEVSGGSKDQPTGRSLFISDNILKRLELPSEPASFCRRFQPVNYEVGLLLAVHFQLMYKAGKTWEYQNQSTGISNFQTTYFLEAEYVVVPSQEVLNAFVKQVSPMMDMIHSNQNIELAKLRDTLLPKLLSGEIELNLAEVNAND
ncbi:restriction endonuclease subunit S [Vibrio vulnificus]|uniref:restriction endonuclease subunit S n=1 Tax=Vibrio vulnificus TaxID=672 RepID=UPI00102B9067|nr:restriction endonuclease subunit S [Vibrio vulnificus]RZR15564.1 restriction endonuclease subunit S [Vibrio vulnificus]